VVTGTPVSGIGTVTPASAFTMVPASSFAAVPMAAAPQMTTVAPASSFAGFQMAPAANTQLSFAIPVSFVAQQPSQGSVSAGFAAVQPAAGTPPMQSGLHPLTPGTSQPPTTTTTTGCATEAQIKALLDARQAATDAKLKDIYALLVLIAKKQNVDVPASKNFSMTVPSPAAEQNMEETRRLLGQIEAKQATWTAAVSTPAVQVDLRITEVQRLLTQISAKQAAWAVPADTSLTVSGR
jgi:hypothetical protein